MSMKLYKLHYGSTEPYEGLIWEKERYFMNLDKAISVMKEISKDPDFHVVLNPDKLRDDGTSWDFCRITEIEVE